MAAAAATTLRPRKTPVQARSEVTVAAIHEATLQVLLQLGPGRLTTVRVAERAGVSVGTLYQYFPNKNALLYALIDSKMQHVTETTEQACSRSHGVSLDRMAEHLVEQFVEAKLRYREASAALYPLAADLGVHQVVQRHMGRMQNAIKRMLLTYPGVNEAQAEAVAVTFSGVLAGTMRAAIEAGASAASMATVRAQLLLLARAYFHAALASDSASRPGQPHATTEQRRPLA